MKLGIIISVVLVIFLSLMGFFAFRGVSDPPSAATSPDKLAQRQLPTDLTPVFNSGIPSGDAAKIYQQAIELYQEHRDAFNQDIPPTEFTNTLVNYLIEAMQRQRVSNGFLDDHLPVKPGAMPDFDDAIEAIPAIALMRAEQVYESGNTAQAIVVTRAVWALGQRAFENNVRLYNRFQGLTIMLDAGDKLLPWSGQAGNQTETHVQQWMKSIHEISKVWQTKFELIARLNPRIGDLINIANNDQDPTFRIAAILKLGIAKFKPGSRGNKRVIEAAIDDAKHDADPLIVQAGIAAGGMTAEQMRKVY